MEGKRIRGCSSTALTTRYDADDREMKFLELFFIVIDPGGLCGPVVQNLVDKKLTVRCPPPILLTMIDPGGVCASCTKSSR